MAQAKKRRTQAERTAASDKAMFKAAIKLIAREGPEKMTLAQLGKEAGFSGGLVSYRFGSKSNMLQATAERILELWSGRVLDPATSSERGLADLELVAKLYLDAVVTKSDLMVAQYRLMNESYTSYKELSPYFSEYDRKVRGDIVVDLERARELGQVKKGVDFEAFAVLFIGMLRGIAVQYFVDSKSFDMEAAYRLVEQTCESILAVD